MWHASVAWQSPVGPRLITSLSFDEGARLWITATRALEGVGDPDREFREALDWSLHLKRRLTDKEWGGKTWGQDYRGLWEGRKRLDKVARYYDDELATRILQELA